MLALAWDHAKMQGYLCAWHSFASHQAQVSVTCSDRIRPQGAGWLCLTSLKKLYDIQFCFILQAECLISKCEPETSLSGSWAVGHVPQEMALLAFAAPDNFYRVLLLWPGSFMHSRKPLRIAVDTELWCTLHVWSANLWAIQSLAVQVWQIQLSSSGSDCNSWDAPVELWEQFQI